MGGPRQIALGALLLLGTPGCGVDPVAERVDRRRAALEAPLLEALCDVPVEGLGLVATETDYLPRVIACENGGADLEALKAQAIAARSVVYWTVGTHGSICDGQGCQAYSCNADPQPIHQEAVDATSGEYLAYNGNVTYAFYVNGDPDTAPPTCVGDPAAPNESWVTYNEGLSGTDVLQTGLGYQHDPNDTGYGQNRGCMGQWGARCLEAIGYDHRAILRAYYGEDISVLEAEGPCVIGEPMGEGGSSEPGTGGGGGTAGGPEASGGGPTLELVTFDDRKDGGCRYAGAASRSPSWLWLVMAASLLAARRRRSPR